MRRSNGNLGRYFSRKVGRNANRGVKEAYEELKQPYEENTAVIHVDETPPHLHFRDFRAVDRGIYRRKTCDRRQRKCGRKSSFEAQERVLRANLYRLELESNKFNGLGPEVFTKKMNWRPSRNGRQVKCDREDYRRPRN